MEKFISNGKNLFWVITNIISLIVCVVIFEVTEADKWNMTKIIIEIVAIVIWIISFIPAYWKNSLYQFTHRSLGKLDERELQITSISLRYAYPVFTIFVLILMYVYSFADKTISVVLIAALIYLANILPASMIILLKERI